MHTGMQYTNYRLAMSRSKSEIALRNDLAGSERVSQTGPEAIRCLEAQKINTSLSALTHVIQAIANKEIHHSV